MTKPGEIIAVGTIANKIFKVMRTDSTHFDLHSGPTVIENVDLENALAWVITQFSQAMGKS